MIKAFKSLGHEQAMVAGIAADEHLDDYSALGAKTYPVYFESEELPFPVVGMSNQMPYPSTLYKNMTKEMTRQLHRSARSKAVVRRKRARSRHPLYSGS